MNLPAAQCLHVCEPEPLANMPAGHSEQRSSLVAFLAVPGGHEVQEDAPRLVAWEPAGQGSHASVDLAACAVEKRPDGHNEHVVVPDDLENEPAAHGKHMSSEDAPVSVEYLPETQLVHEDAPAEECVPAGHARHARACGEPRDTEYFPAGQL